MKIEEYQKNAFQTVQNSGNDRHAWHVSTLGVIGEVGSVASEIKKAFSNGSAYTDFQENLAEEFGDLLWYLSTVASSQDLQLSQLSTEALDKFDCKHDFDHIYFMLDACAELTESMRLSSSGHATPNLAKAVGRAYRAILQAIRKEGLEVEKILDDNLLKIKGMYGSSEIGPAPCFDKDFPDYERLPREADIRVLEHKNGSSQSEVILRFNDLNIGDRLTDNSYGDDGYRFHDAFHLAYAVVLGWSPVSRSILRRKRKSDPVIDEVQDGARAAIMEEAISHIVFDYARGHSMLDGLSELDLGLLKLIQRMTRGLEVEECSMIEWQRAILVGYSAFRQLRENRGGWLFLNAEERSLLYSRDGRVGR